jgi:hypothetical protein
VLEADNLLARLTAEPYESLTSQRAAEICEQSPPGEMLVETSATVELVSADSASGKKLAGKKITVAIDWRTSGQGPPARHQVATWVFPSEARP